VLRVGDEHPQRARLDVLGQHDQRPTRLARRRVQHGHEVLWVLQGPVGHEDQRVLEDRLHPVLVAHHVGREPAVLDDHPLDEAHGHAGLVGLLDRHDALGADARQRLGDRAADHRVLLGGDRRHLDELLALDRPRDPRELGRHRGRALLDPAPQQHRVGTLIQGAHALAHDRLREQRRRRRPVTGLVRRLVGDLAHELRAHVLVLVGELDLARDRHAVVGDRRRAREALENDIAPLRTQGHLDRVGQLVHPCLQQETSLVVEVEALAHRCNFLRSDDRGGAEGMSRLGFRPGRGFLALAAFRCPDPPWRR
jgi:hypothetical protein